MVLGLRWGGARVGDGGAGKTKENVWFALVLVLLLQNDAMSTLAVLFLRTISK